MIRPGWRRFLPDRSQLIWLATIMIGLVAGVSFINLSVARNAAVAANRAVHARYAQAQQQHEALVQALAAAQRGEQIVPKAYDYFSLTPAGVTTVLIKPVAPVSAIESEGERGGPPYWATWWQRLAQP
ncbi:MAG: hypothetical protein WHX53_14000 [Anaerolineae bacterium]